jgi:hypothetical protein
MSGIDVLVRGGESLFVVRYVEPISACLDTSMGGAELQYATEATQGADVVEPKLTCYDSNSDSEFSSDGEDHYECVFRATPANVTALRATRFAWSPSARTLADRIGATTQPIEEIKAAIARAHQAHIQAQIRLL